MTSTTLKDIAQKAGVSMMTVSRVMNNHPKVGQSTREKVKQIAQELRYAPNVAARNLASSKTGLISVLCDRANTSYVSQFLVGVLRCCRTKGFHMLIEETFGDHLKAVEKVRDLTNVNKVDGLILLPPISNDLALVKVLENSSVPFVRIGPDSDLESSAHICIDDYQAAFDMTSLLISTGHKRIAHIKGIEAQSASQQRYQGYLDALSANTLTLTAKYVEQGEFNYKSGMEAAERLFGLDLPPDAIFAANDDMAAGVIAAAHKMGFDVPKDVSVVGFDDTEFALSIWPPLTTVKQPVAEMAEQAVNILADMPHTIDPGNTLRHVMPFEICLRESSKPR